MSIPRFSEARSAAIREGLVAEVETTPPRRSLRGWRNFAVFALSGALVGGAVSGAAWAVRDAAEPDGDRLVPAETAHTEDGVAADAAVPAPEGTIPGMPIVSLLEGGASAVVGDPLAVSLESAPRGTTHVRVTVQCLTAGTLYWGQDPGGNNPSMSCGDADAGAPSSTSWYDFDLAEGRALYLSPESGRFAVSWQYLNLVPTAWGMTASGQSYGVALPDGRVPDLVAVIGVAPDGSRVEGYASSTALESGPRPRTPEEAATWKSQSFEVPVYASDGVTQLGVFHVG